jgi:hypothetical protein
MKRVRALICAVLFCGVAVAGKTAAAQTAAAASDPQAIWNALAKPAFDPGKVATVNNLEIVRDRIHITLESGSLRRAKRKTSAARPD